MSYRVFFRLGRIFIRAERLFLTILLKWYDKRSAKTEPVSTGCKTNVLQKSSQLESGKISVLQKLSQLECGKINALQKPSQLAQVVRRTFG